MHFCILYFCELYFLILHFHISIFCISLHYLAASDWAIARCEAGDLSCARTEEGFVIRVTNEAGQPSSLFIVVIIITIIIIALTSGVLWHNLARVACTYILGSAMLPVEKKPCQGRGWTYNHPQRSDQDRDPWNR